MSAHFALLALCVKANTARGVGLDEARYIPAGVYHWRYGIFAPANDSPPLARMIAALPLLPLDVRLPGEDFEGRGVVAAADVRDRELAYGGRFTSATVNYRWYRLSCLARMTGFLWWLLGAWVICRWSGELYGGMAALLALVLWSSSPHVLAFEQQAIPGLPLTVIWATATYAFRGYLRNPSWSRASVTGVLLGAAQLVSFVSLALFILWPLMSLLHFLTRARGSASVKARTRMLQMAFAVGLSVWVINVGYGFSGSGAPLGSFDFASRTLNGHSPLHGERGADRAVGNCSRSTWLGRVACPLPADYVKGLDRKLDEQEAPPPRRGGEEWPVEVRDNLLSTAEDGRPIGIWAMMLASLILLVGRHPASAPKAEELTLWLAVGGILIMTTSSVGLPSAGVGILPTTPYAIIIASKLARLWRSGRRGIGWVAALLSLFAIADNTTFTYRYHFTSENRARLRLDLRRQWRRLGLPAPAGRTAIGTAEGPGMRYRSFVDSRGVEMNYALFVPRGYRGDRPYPLIVFLHGYGDRGTTGRQFTAVGLPFTLEYREIDFLVLCPQGHSGSWEASGDDARRAMELLAAVQEEYRVDPKRISLTGLSGGGTGAWGLAAEFPGRWAAIVPVASAPGDAGQVPLIKDIPCWCFHNRYDGGSPAANVRERIEALTAAGGRPKYTEFLDVNHNAGDRAYDMPELFDWLSRQRLP